MDKMWFSNSSNYTSFNYFHVLSSPLLKSCIERVDLPVIWKSLFQISRDCHQLECDGNTSCILLHGLLPADETIEEGNFVLRQAVEKFVFCIDMGSLSLEVETLAADICLGLGLQDLGKQSPRNPRVISLLSSLLERSIQKNDLLMDTRKTEEVVTIFHGSRAPSLGIRPYIDRIFKYSCCSPSCFVVAHIYVDRFVQRTKIHLSSLSVHRLLITSVMVAAKFIDDAFFNNAYYAKVGGVSTAEMNKLEMKFLFGLDFRLSVSLQTFGTYCSQLEKEGSAALLVERPIQLCGTEDCWSKNEDSACAQTITR